jgi:putative phage-type endonuclease
MSATALRIIEVTQGTPEWLQARAGNITASRVAELFMEGRKKGTESHTRFVYKAQIVAERLTGKSQEAQFATKFTDGGTEQEPFARATYEVAEGVMVEQPGFVLHQTIPYFGASPDGLVDSDGMIELKCPKISTHIEYILNGVAPEEYHWQMHAGMDVCDRQWCDFVSYCQALEGTPADHLKLFKVRFPRDDKAIADMHDQIDRFNAEVAALIERLKKH